MLTPAGLRMMTELIDFKHRVYAVRDLLYAITYDPVRDPAIAYAARAGRDPNFVADFIDQAWRRTGDRLCICITQGGLA